MNINEGFDRAIIIGASVAGLLTARVLATYFNEVIVVEKDILPGVPLARKSVPQGNHPHIILAKGLELLESWFPGIISEMENNGSQIADTSNNVAWFFGHEWMPRFDSGIKGLITLRPDLEYQIRKRLLDAYSNVNIVTGFQTTGLLHNKADNCIIGIKGQTEDGITRNIEGTLTVDTTGRNSQTPLWLNALGLKQPRETAIELQLGYTSRIYNRPANPKIDWTSHAVYANFPHTGRGGGITSPKTDLWMVTLTGYFGDHPPADDNGFLDFAKSLAKPLVYQLIKDETPVINSKVYKIPQIRRRYYEELSDFPDGFAVIGDAVCVFNPIFAQGITVVGLSVTELEKYLQKQKKSGNGPSTKGSSIYLQRKIAACLRVPWHMTNVINFSYPQLKGRRPFYTPLSTWLLKRIIETCAQNTNACLTFLKVMHMKAPLHRFLRLSFIFPLIFQIFRYLLKRKE